MGQCAGDCDTDAHCAPGLKCYQRDRTGLPVWGCGGETVGSQDYCYDPHVYRHADTLLGKGCNATIPKHAYASLETASVACAALGAKHCSGVWYPGCGGSFVQGGFTLCDAKKKLKSAPSDCVYTKKALDSEAWHLAPAGAHKCDYGATATKAQCETAVAVLALAAGAGAISTTGGNANGAKCTFPFQYKGKQYSACTTADHNKLWCATTSNYDADAKWGDCVTGMLLHSS